MVPCIFFVKKGKIEQVNVCYRRKLYATVFKNSVCKRERGS